MPMRHVLVVEDDANDAFLTKRYLSRWRHPLSVHVAGNLDEALDYLSATPQVALVLLDHMLPGCSGLDLLATIRAGGNASMVPVVMITGNSDARLVERARTAGANSCVLKPVDPEDYERTVSAIADFWLGANLIVRPDARAVVL